MCTEKWSLGEGIWHQCEKEIKIQNLLHNTHTHTHRVVQRHGSRLPAVTVCSVLQTGPLAQDHRHQKTYSSRLPQKKKAIIDSTIKLEITPTHSSCFADTCLEKCVWWCKCLCRKKQMMIERQRGSLKAADGSVRAQASGILMPLCFEF